MSLLLQTCSRFLAQIMLILSVLLLLRGHHYPGGGFIGGLVATAAISLLMFAQGWSHEKLGRTVRGCLAGGVLCLLVSMLLALWCHQPMLAGQWITLHLLHQTIKVGTPLLFDVGIYLIVTGSLSWLIIQVEDKRP